MSSRILRRKARPPLLTLIPPPTQILTLIHRVSPQAPLAKTRRICLKRRNLLTTSLQRPLRANHGKRVKFRSSRVTLEKPKMAWSKWPPNYENFVASPQLFNKQLDQQLSEAQGVNPAHFHNGRNCRKRMKKNDLCHRTQLKLGCSQQRARRCESSPHANYCKTPHSKHRQRLRSRAIVLGCWMQSRRVSRVQTRPQNSRCRVTTRVA